ncbi:MAG: amino acid adenylation domain-containing protein, partial [Acidobacteria bacterium]|nr:amino acid adenylation domain-containing protein [Acidobacteriota bacterium]
LFERQVERTPEALALTFEGSHLTYRELNERANQLAHLLLSLGVSPDSQVGVMMERCVEMVVSLLAVLKAGGAYVPLDPSYPRERLSFMLSDARVSALLTQSHLRERLADAESVQATHVLAVDEMDAALVSRPTANPPVRLTGDHLAYLIYTSGSTGMPKGAMNTHRGIVNRLLWMQARYGLTARDVVLQKTPFSFDVSVWEFFWPLQTGARLVVARPEGHRDTAYLTELIRGEGVTTLHFVPAMLQVFVEAAGVGECDSVQRVICSGEALSAELAARCLERLAGAELHNLYGPTEAAVDVTAWECVRGDERGSVPIGRPIANTEIYILDEGMRAVPVGVGGELYIGGEGLARGYHGRAELTAEKFVPHPHSRKGGERLYRTGEELRSYLGKSLPEYMVPPTFVMLKEWPLTPSGKVDRRALPAPDAAHTRSGSVYVSPRNEVERVLVEVWAEVLRVERVGVNDNYFELGGDSIRSVSLLAIARERGVSLSLQQLFQHQTIAELAKAFGEHGTSSAESRVIEPFGLISAEDRVRMPEGVEDAYPLTMLQAGMLFHIEYSPDSSFYHNVSSYHLRTRFDAEALSSAVRQLIDNHPALRTAFNLTSYSEPLQLVYTHVPVPLLVEDLRQLSEGDQEQLIAETVEAEKSLKFDAARAPLLRFRAQRRTDDTFQFTLTEHHAILDGWSAASLLAELFERYFAILRNGDSNISVSKPGVAFRDFVALEREILQSGEAREYWSRKLSGSSVAMIPRWPKSSEVSESAKLIHVEVPVSPEISAGLKSIAHTAGVPLKSVLLAAYLRVMSLLSAQQDVVTGIVSHGRPEGADGERVLGLFLNTLPFRLKLSGGTWIDLARETFEAERELLPYRRYPMAQIQNEQGHALFETFFNFVNFHVYEGMQRTNEVELLGGTAFSDTNYTLSAEFSLDKDSSDITLMLSGGAAELGREQLNAIRDYFTATLTSMSLTPSSRYEFARLLPGDEQHQLLVGWNRTKRDYPADLCLHHLFEQQVERTPQALALIASDDRLTYTELNEHANRLAHHLLSLGVCAETRVGVMMERSSLLLVSLLAVHKAGGAYV